MVDQILIPENGSNFETSIKSNTRKEEMKKKKFNCPAEMTLSLMDGKWKAILLFNLRKGPKRFGELRRLSPGINHATLSNQLRELEKNGLVERHELSPAPKLAVEYCLTERAEALKPALYALIRWGIAHQKEYVVGEYGMAHFHKSS
jgi:DNA-binding HxlR family transcriptional regulator